MNVAYTKFACDPPISGYFLFSPLDFLYEYVPLPGTDKDHAERNILRLTSADRSVIAYDLLGVCPALIISNGIKPQTEEFVASAGT